MHEKSHAPVAVIVFHFEEGPVGNHVNGQFLAQLPTQGLCDALPRLDLAPGKLPEAALVGIVAPPSDQQLAAAVARPYDLLFG